MAQKQLLRFSRAASGRGRTWPVGLDAEAREADGEADGSSSKRLLSSKESDGDREERAGSRQRALGGLQGRLLGRKRLESKPETEMRGRDTG